MELTISIENMVASTKLAEEFDLPKIEAKLEPYVDFASTFLMERPDHDYLKEAAPYP